MGGALVRGVRPLLTPLDWHAWGRGLLTLGAARSVG